jgi:hypothetical protein
MATDPSPPAPPTSLAPLRRLPRPKSGAHAEKALTAVFVRNAREPGRYADGHGLHLLVTPSGAKRWIQRLVIRGRRTDLGLGPVSLVSLAEARELALANRKAARAGADPLQAKRDVAGVPTFAQAVEIYLEKKGRRVLQPQAPRAVAQHAGRLRRPRARIPPCG